SGLETSFHRLAPCGFSQSPSLGRTPDFRPEPGTPSRRLQMVQPKRMQAVGAPVPDEHPSSAAAAPACRNDSEPTYGAAVVCNFLVRVKYLQSPRLLYSPQCTVPSLRGLRPASARKPV